MNNLSSDQGIPVLTEILEKETADQPQAASQQVPVRAATPAGTRPVTKPAEPSAVASPMATPSPAAPRMPPVAPAPAVTSTPAPASASQPVAKENISPASLPELTSHSALMTDEDWNQLESELRQRITRQVLGRIDFVLEHRVRNTLTDVVDAAIDGLAAEIKRGLHETLTDMITRAVAKEISRVQLPKK